MKIEIISGTKDEPPTGMNTHIKIDGKDITKQLLIDKIFFQVRAGEVANWGISFTGDTWLKKFITNSKHLKTLLKKC